MKIYIKTLILVAFLLFNHKSVYSGHYYGEHKNYYYNIENYKDFFQFYMNNEENENSPYEWGVEVIWAKKLDDELLIYVNENMLAFIKDKREDAFLYNLQNTMGGFEDISTLSIFVKNKGYYIKRGEYLGDKLYESR